jgi:hypothetical protein
LIVEIIKKESRLEYNRAEISDSAKPYYELATQLSSNPVYQQLYDMFLERSY